VAGGDAELIYWDLPTRKEIGAPITSQKDRIWSLAFNPQNNSLASLGNGLQISLWKDGRHDQPVKTIGSATQDHDIEIMPAGVAFNAEGTLMAASSPSHSVTLWNVKDWQPIAPVLYGHSQTVSSVAFAPDGKVLASGGADGDIRLWDIKTHESIGSLSLQPEEVKSIAFAPDGKMLASVDAKDAIVLWNADLQGWISRACAIANRNLTAKEWTTYFGAKPYQRTCTDP
jgi:WD40 repeat protein